jgi:hypothetical protein
MAATAGGTWASLARRRPQQQDQRRKDKDNNKDTEPAPATILEVRSQGGRITRLVDLNRIERSARASTASTTNRWRKCAPGAVYTADDIPVELWSHIFSYLEDARDFLAASSVCHLWHEALTDRRCWARARIPVCNPEWVQQPGCDHAFLTPSDSLRGFGFHFVEESQLAHIKRRSIKRIILQGPNILKQSAHIKQLSCELPEMEEVAFVCTAPAEDALELLRQGCPGLATVRAVYWSHAALPRLAALTSTTTLYLENCVGLSQRGLLVLCERLPKLRKVFVLGCDGLDLPTLAPVSKALPRITIMYAPVSHMFSMWYFRRAWPSLPPLGYM